MSDTAQATKKARKKPTVKAHKLSSNYDQKAMIWFKQQNWASLWKKFCTEVDSKGGAKYKTAFSLCRATCGENTDAEDWMYAAIGPEPQSPDNDPDWRPVVKWMGNWEQRRHEGAWFGSDKSKVVERAIQQTEMSLDIAKKAGQVTLGMLSDLARLQQKVHNHFGGEVYLEGNTTNANGVRRKQYLGALERIVRMYVQANEAFMYNLGLDRQSMVQLVTAHISQHNTSAQLNVGQGEGAPVLDGTKGGVPQLMPGTDPVSQLIAMTMNQKHSILKVPLPPIVVADEGEKKRLEDVFKNAKAEVKH